MFTLFAICCTITDPLTPLNAIASVALVHQVRTQPTPRDTELRSEIV